MRKRPSQARTLELLRDPLRPLDDWAGVVPHVAVDQAVRVPRPEHHGEPGLRLDCQAAAIAVAWARDSSRTKPLAPPCAAATADALRVAILRASRSRA